MRKQADGKVRRSREEWRAIIGRFHSSGMTGAAFCRREKLPKSSFEKWKRKIGSRPKVTRKQPNFVEWPTPTAPILPMDNADRSSAQFELSLPGGVVLRWNA